MLDRPLCKAFNEQFSRRGNVLRQELASIRDVTLLAHCQEFPMLLLRAIAM